MKNWIKGLIVGIILWVLLYLSLSFVCPDFFYVGPLYPTDQPICHFLIVNGGWMYGFILVITGTLIGWMIDRKR